MREVAAFQCQSCEFTRTQPSLVRRHERRCWRDPGNHACYTCGLFSTTEADEPVLAGMGDVAYIPYRALWCGDEEISEKDIHCGKWRAKVE